MVRLNSPADSSVVTLPSKPGRVSYTGGHPLYFYSVPNSPIGDASFDWNTEAAAAAAAVLTTNFGVSDGVDGCEVDTLLQQHKKKHHQQEKDGFDAMTSATAADATADASPQIQPPLKLPPYLQNNNKAKANGTSTSSSLSRNSALRRSFSRLSFRRNDLDVDPFMAALVQVRDEEREREQGAVSYNRSQSLSGLNTNSENSSFNSATAFLQQTSSQQVAVPLGRTRQRSRKKNRSGLIRSYSERREVLGFKDKVRPCTAAIRRFLQIWKSGFKHFLQSGNNGCLRSHKRNSNSQS